jgi:predicted O-methyltransferase YrrM
MESSYANKTLSYGDFFRLISWQMQPKCIVEFGILNGYSLEHFREGAAVDTQIYAYDIFDKFVGNSAKRTIIDRFKTYPNIHIEEGDYYLKYKEIPDGSVDILHIDIANNGDVYDFAVSNYLSKLTPFGIMILEGGSAERDNVDWMIKYSKPPINPIFEKYKTIVDIFKLNGFPSATIMRRIQSK